MNSDTISHIDVTALFPHPNNPRIEPREDIIDQIAQRIASGFDPSHALIVRPIADGYQIISGHHRAKAAERANLPTVPCWVREMSDADAYMQLVLCNTQSELHPLEEGKHASESGMDLKAYCEASGKVYKTLYDKVRAWRVYSVVSDVLHMQNKEPARKAWRQLGDIDAAPRWLWSALVAQMIEASWTVAVTRERVQSVKEILEPHPSFDTAAIASALMSGSMKAVDIERMSAAVRDAKVRDDDSDQLASQMRKAIKDARPSRLSAVQEIVLRFETEQSRRDAEARAAEIAAQKADEDAQARVANLRKNCSLDEWKSLSDDERASLLSPEPGAGGTFNQQKNESIEWAQWSWNPVTGCKHDCPYCYARDIALSERMQQASLYPNGFDPTFRSLSLNGPKNTKVPKEAAADTRYRNVFTCSMADLFGRWVPIEWINAVMMAARGNPQWNFLFLTKFPQRLAEVEIPDNAWMGTTVDMQARVKNAERAFEKVNGGVRWLSVEPMIEPLKFERLDLFDWVVIGGASSSSKTPAWRPPFEWVYDLVMQARDAGCKVYMKSNLFGLQKDFSGPYNGNARILELPFDAPIKGDPKEAPEVFRYLGK